MEEILYCDICCRRMVRDEIALNRKLNGLETEEFLCLTCMAEELAARSFPHPAGERHTRLFATSRIIAVTSRALILSSSFARIS